MIEITSHVLGLVIGVCPCTPGICHVGERLVRRWRGGVTLQQESPQALPGQALQWRRGGLDDGDARA
jgi:hypothetical protein